jgi:hypothetical protein
MNILTEITELADEIIMELIELGFFKQNIFVDALELKRKIEIQMQYNWEQIDNMHLSDSQFEDIIKEVHREGIIKTMDTLYMDEILVADSIDKDGEIVYKLNPEINIDDYLQSK